MASFSKSEAISYGWKQTVKNFSFFFIVLLIILAVNVLPSVIAGILSDDGGSLLSFVATLIGWALQLIVSLGSIGIALRIHDKRKAEYKNLFDYSRLVIPYFFGSIVYTVIVIVGFILLIIPGIIWGIKFRYYPYFMVDRNIGPIDAMKESSKITAGNKWNLFLFGIILGFINLIGALALLVGLFVTIPLTMMAEAYVFRKLAHKK
jgi:uncharacterized membrane protein